MKTKRSNNDEFAKEMIITHYETPFCKLKDKKTINKQYFCGHTSSPSCIDNIKSYVLIKNKKIIDVKFSGIGCAICTSSTDLLALQITDKTIKTAKKVIDNCLKMAIGEKFDKKIIGNLIIYQDVYKQTNRIKCLTTGIQAINNALNKYEKEK